MAGGHEPFQRRQRQRGPVAAAKVRPDLLLQKHSSEDEEDDAEGDQGDAEDHGAALSSDGDDEALQ